MSLSVQNKLLNNAEAGQLGVEEANDSIHDIPEDQHEDEKLGNVTSQLRIKQRCASPSQPLDKEVVLRRIRQRKRSNKLRTTLQSLILGSACFTSKSKTDKAAVSDKKWIDDAFAAL